MEALHSHINKPASLCLQNKYKTILLTGFWVGKRNNTKKWSFLNESALLCLLQLNPCTSSLWIYFVCTGWCGQTDCGTYFASNLFKEMYLCEDGFTAYVLLQVHKSNYTFFSLEEIEQCLAINGWPETCGIFARH